MVLDYGQDLLFKEKGKRCQRIPGPTYWLPSPFWRLKWKQGTENVGYCSSSLYSQTWNSFTHDLSEIELVLVRILSQGWEEKRQARGKKRNHPCGNEEGVGWSQMSSKWQEKQHRKTRCNGSREQAVLHSPRWWCIRLWLWQPYHNSRWRGQ